MKQKSQSQSSQVKGSKPKTERRFLDKLSFKLLKCLCLVPYCGETNVKNALGDSIFAQENQAIEQQKLEGEPALTPSISMANMMKKFQSSTRDLSLPSLSHGKHELMLTRPKEPEFETAQRVRSVKFADLEDAMMPKIPKFKARPVNEKIFEAPEAPTLPALPRSTPQLPEFKEFQFETTVRANQNAETASVVSTEVSHQDAAATIIQWKQLALTRPKEPEFETAQRVRSVKFADLEEEMMTKTPKFKARPVNEKIFEAPTLPALPRSAPPSAVVADLFDELSLNSKPRNPLPRNTVPNLFHLHTEERGAKKERKLMMELAEKQREDERARAPKTNQYPFTTDFRGIPPIPEPKPCKPFQLEILVRHEEEMQRQMDKGLRIEKEEEEKRIFRAQPILKKDPIPVPERVRKPPTQVQQFDLRVDHRAVDRAECDQKVKEKEHLHKRYRQERETARTIEEKKAVKELRTTMVPRARPMPDFDNPFRPKKSAKAARKAKLPNLQLVWRKQRQDNGKCNLQPRFIQETIDLSFGSGSFRFLDYHF